MYAGHDRMMLVSTMVSFAVGALGIVYRGEVSSTVFWLATVKTG